VGERQNQPFRFSFSSSLKVDFQGSQVTSDAGLLLVRELDERLGLGQLIREILPTPAAARIRNCPCPICCANRCTAAWLAEAHLTHERFAAMLRRIAMLPLPAS
jgi:hypothetical protein